MVVSGRLRFGVIGTVAAASCFRSSVTGSVAVAASPRFGVTGLPVGVFRHGAFVDLAFDQDRDSKRFGAFRLYQRFVFAFFDPFLNKDLSCPEPECNRGGTSRPFYIWRHKTLYLDFLQLPAQEAWLPGDLIYDGGPSVAGRS